VLSKPIIVAGLRIEATSGGTRQDDSRKALGAKSTMDRTPRPPVKPPGHRQAAHKKKEGLVFDVIIVVCAVMAYGSVFVAHLFFAFRQI